MPTEINNLKNRLMNMTNIIIITEKKLVKVRKSNKMLKQEIKNLKLEVERLNESKKW